jgi:N-acetyl sugar amidotransferase
MDTSDPDITFDASGVCNHCRLADRVLPSVRWTPEASQRALADVVENIRKAGAGQEYDSVIGLSGGVDSSYAAYLAHQHGLRPLAVHFDNGWNSELAVENIQRLVEGCGFDLHTYVIDWREFRDIQRAFLRASVVDIELVTDHAIVAAMIGLARQHGIRYLLSGYNLATEHGLPSAWVWHKLDWTNIRAIHAAYGSIPLRTYPHLSTTRWRLLQFLGRGVKSVQMLNLMNYRRDEAAATLQREFGWREYGGKHHESAFTKFYQGAILPRKFGIDKRRVHLSDRLRNGELARDEALAILACPPYEPDELRAESDYVRKKLGFDEAEWEAIMSAPPRPHSDFASDRNSVVRIAMFRAVRGLRRRIVKDEGGVL